MTPAPKELSLPALKSLGELAKARPTIIQDTREQRGLPFRRLLYVIATLPEGDYGISGVSDFLVSFVFLLSRACARRAVIDYAFRALERKNSLEHSWTLKLSE